MFDKNENKIEIENNVYIDGCYGIVSSMDEESDKVTITVDEVEYTYNGFELLVIEDYIYHNLELIDREINEAKTDIAWSDNDDTIALLEEKIKNLEEEKNKIIEEIDAVMV